MKPKTKSAAQYRYQWWLGRARSMKQFRQWDDYYDALHRARVSRRELAEFKK